MRRVVILACATVMIACAKPPTTMQVCKELEAASVAANCRATPAGGLGGAASDHTDFDLPSVPGKGGAVFGFRTDADYASTVAAYQGAAALAGPHRYGNQRRRIFVQMNSGAAPELGGKTKALVDAL